MKFVLIDFQHLAYKCMVMPPMSVLTKINGEVRVVDTTIPTGTIKNVVKYSGNGAYYTGVFLEGGTDRGKIDAGYKANRQKQSSTFYEGVNLAVSLMLNGGVSLYRVAGCEADDLICSMVYSLREAYPEAEIEVITCDADLLSLVDEKCSVWMKGTRQFALIKSEERRLYYQVTPDTWDAFMSGTSAYGEYNIPYNAIMLYKMIKGDKADNINMAVRGYGKVKFSELMKRMRSDGVPFEKIFRNHNDFDRVIRPILSIYFSPEEVEAMKINHSLIRMKTDVGLQRPNQIDIGRLQKALLDVDIHIVK